MTDYQLGLYEKALPNDLRLAQKLQAARAAGFDFLEMSIDETDQKLARLDWPAAQRINLRGQMDAQGISIKTICLSGHRKYPLGSSDKQTAARSLGIMEKAIELGCDLGVRLIQLAGYDVYYDESTVRTELIFRENLQKAVQMAARAGMVLAFETMETPFMDTVNKAMHYVRMIDSPYLQIYPDTGNLTNALSNSQKEMQNDLQIGAGHIAAAHLKETAFGQYRDMQFGSGHTPFTFWIKALRRMGVCLFTGEFWYDGTDNYMEYIQKANLFLRKQFTQAEVIE